MKIVVLATGGFIAALLASTCCVLPAAVAGLGVGSALLSTSASIATYEMGFRIAAILLLASGFWLVYSPPKSLQGLSACSTRNTTWTTKAFLWAGAAVMALVFTAGWWAHATT